MQMVLAIAAGGALGAVSRHYAAAGVTRLLGSGFPYGIMVVNILGSFLMGLLVSVFAARLDVSLEMRAFLTVGFLGAFTTFSTYSLEIMLLIERGQWGQAAFYALGSMLLGLAGLFIGMQAGRFFA